MPKKTPITVHNKIATAGAQSGNDDGSGVNCESVQEINQAKMTPPAPPTQQSTTDSTRNWLTTSCCRAPTAFRIPISLVRSTTDTSIMFMMTMPPTTSEIPTTNNDTEKITLVRLLNNSLTPSEVIKPKSSSS